MQKFIVIYRLYICWLLLCFFWLLPISSVSAPWWSQQKIEENRKVAENIQYRRILYQTTLNEPVRAHVITLSDTTEKYILGVLGSFGSLFSPSQFAQNSGAVVVINGSFFSENPTRALTMVTAHNRVLYPPTSGEMYHSTVGFSSKETLFDWIRPSDIRGDRIYTEKPGWNACHAALGAGPMLIKAGNPTIASVTEGFNLTQVAPRTAIGKRQDGTVLMVVVDGRQPSWSAGVTLAELAEIFIDLQAFDALNLDGGGSSTLVIQNQIVNRPSDGSIHNNAGIERPVANVIALFNRK